MYECLRGISLKKHIFRFFYTNLFQFLYTFTCKAIFVTLYLLLKYFFQHFFVFFFHLTDFPHRHLVIRHFFAKKRKIALFLFFCTCFDLAFKVLV